MGNAMQNSVHIKIHMYNIYKNLWNNCELKRLNMTEFERIMMVYKGGRQ